MPDPVLFALGTLVAAVVGLAVWSVGLIGGEKDRGRSGADEHLSG